MITLHLGTGFDGPVYAPDRHILAGHLYAGPSRILHWLEVQLGLEGYPDQTDYLRIELYRQALQQFAGSAETPPFYAASLTADRFATAQGLLTLRDDLLLSGWDFHPQASMPERLQTLAAVESIYQKKIGAPEHKLGAQGYADRFERVYHLLEQNPLPVKEILLYEPEQGIPAPLKRLAAHWRRMGIPLQMVLPEVVADPETDLGWLQQKIILKTPGKRPVRRDGSLLLLATRRDSDAASLIAGIVANNPNWRPLLLLPEMNRSLEQTMLLQGLPAEGVLSASLARPSLQVLKLAPAFIWEPVDVFKVMEFVTLAVKPLDDGLALVIARVMADKPGLFSERWFAAVLEYLEQEGVGSEVRKQYDFWFDRKRYRADAPAPKAVAIEIYDYLMQWARDLYAHQSARNSSLLVLAEQARRIRDLLKALPESQISFLELERIVRTIYEPSPVQITTGAEGRLDFVHHPGAIAGRVDAFLWWNCVYDETALPPDPWQAEERKWLSGCGVEPISPAAIATRQLYHRQIPIWRTSARLLLVMPEQVAGSEALPSLLKGDLEAAFSDLHQLVIEADSPQGQVQLADWFRLPGMEPVPSRQITRTRPFLSLDTPEIIADSPYETPTNLESLFYYPHRWFLRSKALLYPVSLYSVTPDRTLLGNLAHRFFEELLQQDFYTWERGQVHEWLNAQAPGLLEKEGATLLLYGREPERKVFLQRLQQAAWSLITLLRNNHWQVQGTEISLEGVFAGVPMRGKADLVLRRGEEQAIVDLKWSGARRRLEMIRNREDLQLVLYAHLLPPEGQWPHTAYFILEEGRMIARNSAAFKEAQTADNTADHALVCQEVLGRMESTFQWRMEQVRAGRLELRTARTAGELDALYGEVLLDLLEMREEDARWDDYRILLDFME